MTTEQTEKKGFLGRMKDKFKSTSFNRKAFELQMSHLAILVVGGWMLAWIVYLVISWNNARQNEMTLRKPMNEARQSLRKVSDDNQAELAEVVQKLATEQDIDQATLSSLMDPSEITIYTQDRGKAYGKDIMFIDGDNTSPTSLSAKFSSGYVDSLEREWLVGGVDSIEWEEVTWPMIGHKIRIKE